MKAHFDSPLCIQRDPFRRDLEIAGSEDCLFLNVYAPEVVREPLPVMVFFHGGGYMVSFLHFNRNTLVMFKLFIFSAAVESNLFTAPTFSLIMTSFISVQTFVLVHLDSFLQVKKIAGEISGSKIKHKSCDGLKKIFPCLEEIQIW